MKRGTLVLSLFLVSILLISGCEPQMSNQRISNEKITIKGINQLYPNKTVDCNIVGNKKNNTIKLLSRIDTLMELEYYKSGGILQYVLNSITNKTSELNAIN